MNLFRHCSGIHSLRLLSQSLIAFVLSTAGLLTGLAPNLSVRSPALEFSVVAIAQTTISDREVSSYARSILDLEPIRKETLETIQKIMGQVPPIACGEPKSIEALPANVREIAVKFCEDSNKIVVRTGLNISRFNEITRSLQNNPTLEQRIQQEMIRLRQSSGSQ